MTKIQQALRGRSGQASPVPMLLQHRDSGGTDTAAVCQTIGNGQT